MQGISCAYALRACKQLQMVRAGPRDALRGVAAGAECLLHDGMINAKLFILKHDARQHPVDLIKC